ncbi:hypothetical protein [Mesorhizobium sp. M0802]|uniref:hypothetical protein n=1 Tax=Mesorhizobium sp. M0802 TaxID=2957001 RepID=UPI003338018D
MSAERMLWENDATGLAELLHRGEISPPDLVDAAIARAEATRSLRIRRLPAAPWTRRGPTSSSNLLDKLHLTRALEIRSLFGRLMDKSLWLPLAGNPEWPAARHPGRRPPRRRADGFVARRADGEDFRLADAAGAAQGAGLIRQISSS